MDAIMDGKRDTGKAIDQFEIGLTIGLGDIGKIALSHVNSKDTTVMKSVAGEVGMPNVLGKEAVPMMYMINHDKDSGADATAMISVMKEMVTVAVANSTHLDSKGNPVPDNANGDEANAFVKHIMKDNDGYFIGDSGDSSDARCMEPSDAAEDAEATCKTVEIYVQIETEVSSDAENNTDNMRTIGTTVTETYYLANEFTGNNVSTTDPKGKVDAKPSIPTTLPTEEEDTKFGYKASHISAEFGLGGITAALGYSQTDSNDPDMSDKAKVAFLGFKGSFGDSGLNWGAYSRKKTSHAGEETKPWTIGVSKALGGGATTYVEHGNDGSDGTTNIALRVDF